MSVLSYKHTPEDLRRGLKESLQALGTEKIDMWYVTLREVNELYKEGYFTRLGISNYMSWEGIYSAIHHVIEPELFPCLRYCNIALYSFQPLAGGVLTSRYRRDMSDEEHEPGSRFDPKRWQGNLHRGRYWNNGMKKEKGDAVIVGASSAAQLEQNLTDMEKGPLPEEMVEALDVAWLRVKGVVPKYFH
ncbi:NADP-dependent oxidoreductase domain-containing protein [Aspergillus caelatus]|uniref:NADP-dependent oxidoreductase domain-containing protein n=1 Tax=Aspergillus caelatus TaxID=61420 RepID=A0A5N7AKY5_9EURO|nr:NADP-dependent oxidoreductase domain-containing protein [Aspergillus caelatus]KAE8369678.1 NADP-dependent oxidoreductase domain-containing protein [Aspergillus caelatus]